MIRSSLTSPDLRKVNVPCNSVMTRTPTESIKVSIMCLFTDVASITICHMSTHDFVVFEFFAVWHDIVLYENYVAPHLGDQSLMSASIHLGS